jgi:CelD/BcsL family acetyltransferase involved in cellulose biosynthesis
VLRYRVIASEDEFLSLECAWRDLEGVARVHPFQSFAWNRCWVQTLGRTEDRRLCVATAWDEERLVGVLPFSVRRYRGSRLLEWLGARASDYCDAIIDPQVDVNLVLASLWRLVEQRSHADICRLGQVRGDAVLAALIRSRDPWIETRESSLSLPITWRSGEAWLHAQSGHRRKHIRAHRRRLEAQGFTFSQWGPPDPLDRWLTAIIGQKRAWLHSQKGASDLLESSRGEAFLRQVSAALAAEGTLHLSAYRSGEGFAACHLGMFRHGVLYGYMLSFDPQLAALSPGTALQDALLMWACDQQARALDMLRGDHDYKHRPEVVTQSLCTYVLPNSFLGKTCLAAYRWRAQCRALGTRPRALSEGQHLPA